MATEGLLSFAAATASIVDVDLNRKTRGDALMWHEQDLAFMDEQRRWHDLDLKHRREDINFRRQEIEQRNLVNRRREIDEKNEQLKNIANIAALVAGFSLVLVFQMDYQETPPDWLFGFYAAFAAASICLMTYTYVTCTLILVGTLKKFEVFSCLDEEATFFYTRKMTRNDGTLNASIQRHESFDNDDSEELERQIFQKTRFMLFWESTCEPDFNRAYIAFSLGVPCGLMAIAFASFIKFLPSLVPGAVLSAFCGFTIVVLFWDAHMKWGVFLTSKSAQMSQQQSDSQRAKASQRGQSTDFAEQRPPSVGGPAVIPKTPAVQTSPAMSGSIQRMQHGTLNSPNGSRHGIHEESIV